jgi:hypothetical protein
LGGGPHRQCYSVVLVPPTSPTLRDVYSGSQWSELVDLFRCAASRTSRPATEGAFWRACIFTDNVVLQLSLHHSGWSIRLSDAKHPQASPITLQRLGGVIDLLCILSICSKSL